MVVAALAFLRTALLWLPLLLVLLLVLLLARLVVLLLLLAVRLSLLLLRLPLWAILVLPLLVLLRGVFLCGSAFARTGRSLAAPSASATFVVGAALLCGATFRHLLRSCLLIAL